MPTHIFSINEENWRIAQNRGVVGIPGFPDGKKDLNDQLLSRILIVKPGDDILFYISKQKSLYGIYSAMDCGFYDETPLWNSENNQLYPFRIRFDVANYTFNIPITLDEIYDLKDNGKIWTFSLFRPNSNAPNAMFSITNGEKEEIFKLLMKKNATELKIKKIKEPYPNKDPDLLDKLTIVDNVPKYEATITALLNKAFAQKKFSDLFGDYTDYIAYIPTSFQKEIDLIILTENPCNKTEILSYNIIEVKKDLFDEKALTQLIQYEEWFLRKKASGDHTMVRTTGIAKRYSDDVIDYVKKRKKIENKEVILLSYCYKNNELGLTRAL